MKHLVKFNDGLAKMSWQASEDHVSPNVTLVEDTGELGYNVQAISPVHIQHINGKIYTTDEWTAAGFSQNAANGVAVITDKVRFVIAKTDIVNTKRWSGDVSNKVDGILTSDNSSTAATDFAGQENTDKMLATDINGAGYSCANYTFPNGAKGYLPALGEWNEARKHRKEINSAMLLIGGAEFASKYYWTSTQVSNTSAWAKNLGSMNASGNYLKSESHNVRAFTSLIL